MGPYPWWKNTQVLSLSPKRDPSWTLWLRLKPPSKTEAQWTPSPESLMNTKTKSTLNNSLTTNSTKNKPKNVPENSNSELVKSKKELPPLKKDKKPSMDANNNKSEPNLILPSPKNNWKKKPLNWSTSTPPEKEKNTLLIPLKVFSES